MKMETRSRAIDKIYKRRDRIEMPDFQREEVWSDDRKRLLIDSILRGWHLPKVFVYRVEARKSAKWCAGLVRMCRYVQYGSRGRQTGRFEGARARG